MYLVHARLHSPDGAALPERVAQLLTDCAFESEGLEHVTVHLDDGAGPVLGLFLTASGLDLAESNARALCCRAVELCPQLRAFTVADCGVPLVPGHWDGLLAADDPGRLMPLHDPSSSNPFHPF
jgi:hypothetical protein